MNPSSNPSSGSNPAPAPISAVPSLEVPHPSSPAWLTAAQRGAMTGSSIPASVPPRAGTPLPPASADDAEKNVVEVKKNEKILIAGREEIEKITKQRKLKFSDLITVKPAASLSGSGMSKIISPRIFYVFHSHPAPGSAAPAGPSGGWPYELILVRHGQSEGNLAVSRSEKGDLSSYTPEFKNKHSSSYRLTDKGVKQAKVTGEWIRENIGDQFDRYYTSEYVRAMETAAHLGLPNAQWYTEIVLRERDKGTILRICRRNCSPTSFLFSRRPHG